jgi:hypothetical protein
MPADNMLTGLPADRRYFQGRCVDGYPVGGGNYRPDHICDSEAGEKAIGMVFYFIPKQIVHL